MFIHRPPREGWAVFAWHRFEAYTEIGGIRARCHFGGERAG